MGQQIYGSRALAVQSQKDSEVYHIWQKHSTVELSDVEEDQLMQTIEDFVNTPSYVARFKDGRESL